MKIDIATDGGLGTSDLAQAAEWQDYDGMWVGEVCHDPFLQLALAAATTDQITLGTSIAVAFARNPMTTALVADDLQAISNGRFILGLGTQIRSHITRRFSMPWSQPVERLGEYVSAVKVIWACWHHDTPLDFRGDFYTHTLMPPMFRPDQHGYGPPPILLAGVGPKMTALAGRVADGFLCHGFNTETYLRNVTVPALVEGRGAALTNFAVVGNPFIVVGRTEEELDTAAAAVRQQIAFYGSTPAYRPVFDLHGWSALGDKLHALSKQNRWSDMEHLITDDVLRAFAVVGGPTDVGRQISERYHGIFTRAVLAPPYHVEPDVLAEVAFAARSCLTAADDEPGTSGQATQPDSRSRLTPRSP